MLVGEPPAVVQDWLEQRRACGQDLFDEVWVGEYHVAPAPHGHHGDVDHQIAVLLGPRARAAGLRGSGPLNIGTPQDYRVPAQAYLRRRAETVFVPTAAVVVEIVSPGDETFEKFAFYFAHDVEELLVADPGGRSVAWWSRGAEGFERAAGSAVLGVAGDDLAAAIDWP